jgi:hypothetical protein
MLLSVGGFKASFFSSKEKLILLNLQYIYSEKEFRKIRYNYFLLYF